MRFFNFDFRFLNVEFFPQALLKGSLNHGGEHTGNHGREIKFPELGNPVVPDPVLDRVLVPMPDPVLGIKTS